MDHVLRKNHQLPPTRPAAVLSPSRRRLLMAIRRMWYGEIVGLKIRDGEPVLDPSPEFIQEHKYGCEPPKEIGNDLTLYLQESRVRELLGVFSRQRNVEFSRFEVQRGLPFIHKWKGTIHDYE